MCADAYPVNTRVLSQHRHLKSLGYFLWVLKLSFRFIRGQVKSHHYSEQIGVRRPYFHFSYRFIEIISQKQLGQLFWKLIWIYCYLLNEVGLNLDLHNSSLVQKILTVAATNNINVWFFKHHTLSHLGKFDLIILQIA